MVSKKEDVDDKRIEEALRQAKVIAAASDDLHVDDDGHSGRICDALVVSCVSSYISITSRAKATCKDALRKNISPERTKYANMTAEVQHLQE